MDNMIALRMTSYFKKDGMKKLNFSGGEPFLQPKEFVPQNPGQPPPPPPRGEQGATIHEFRGKKSYFLPVSMWKDLGISPRLQTAGTMHP